MFSSIGSSRLLTWLMPPLLLGGLGAILRPLETRLLPDPTPAALAWAGHGGTLAVLGGMRGVLAGCLWLRTNLAWERRDAAATTELLHLTVAADERPLAFWLNGARMIAYDFTAWRTPDDAPPAVRRRIVAAQSEAALAFLQRGVQARGPAAELYVEMANIRLRALGDREGAAELFRQAALQNGAPYYAARIHAELLRELGRSAEALAWLRRVEPTLPAHDPAAQREVVRARIKGLEQEVARK
ncbi:MAG TPA: hypothetical protein VG734_26300 [Lacunisphaera sp.]|nr:hypothetical protein [Lacunisphaera sp.]